MTRTSCPYDDRIRHHPYQRLTAPVPDHLDSLSSINHLHSPPQTTLPFDATYKTTSDLPLLSHPSGQFVLSSVQYAGQSYCPPPLAYPSYSLLPGGSVSSSLNDTFTDGKNLSRKNVNIYAPWSIDHPSPVSPPPASSMVDLHSDFSPPKLPATRWRVSPVEELLPTPNNYHSPTLQFEASSLSYRHLDDASDSRSRTSNAFHPCLWTEDGAICNVMVQATRSHMNRHLHAFHGFDGFEARQTMCNWVRCGEVMQQGSIARHAVTCHLQVKVTCPMCAKKLSRQDVISKHRRVCPAASALGRARMH